VPETDPRALYHGKAGLLAMLIRADPGAPVVTDLLRRLEASSASGPTLPGLYSGTSDIARAAFDAVTIRGEDHSTARWCTSS
jgi:hypothetical protein